MQRLSFGFALAAFLATASAQEVPAPIPDWYRVQSALAQWRGDHGDVWRIEYGDEIGRARIVWGGSVPAPFAPASEADWFALAREHAEAVRTLTGIEPSTLVADRVKFLPLGLGGTTTDKLAVRFRQAVDGVPVVDGWLNVLFALDGTLLGIDATGLPDLTGFDSAPALTVAQAHTIASGLFVADHGSPPTYTKGTRLAIEQAVLDGKRRTPVLVWEVDLLDLERDAHAGNVYRIDAHTGALVTRLENVHQFDVSGTVETNASGGLLPYGQAGNVGVPMPYVDVQSPQGDATTDANGNFTIVGASAPVQITIEYDGTYHTSDNTAGADYQYVIQLNQDTGNALTMNPSSTADPTAEANCYNWVHRLRDYIKTTDPTDTTADFVVRSNTNVVGTCNAFYNGISINFFPAGGGCVNTAYSTVVVHEEGHWLNDRYGSGNGSDGFGEGNADMFAMYSTDDPVVGAGFSGPGSFIRTGLNTRQWCGSGCYGQVHTDGEVWMGAGWKIRARLQAALGSSVGSATADALFINWMNAFNQTTISPTIETQWLMLDDDDGNIGNGTPNYPHIEGGFLDQGFPGVPLVYVDIQNVTILGDTQNDVAIRTVSADMVTNFNPPVLLPTLHYRVDAGPYQAVPMQLVGGTTYEADIPVIDSPAFVDYYVSAFDGMGVQNTFPATGASDPLSYKVGVLTTYFADSFETNSGWTHDTSGVQDDWQRTAGVGASNGAFGKAGDPTSAADGTQIWGNDLGPDGWNGFYQDNNANALTSPPIDLTFADVPLILSFERWATVEAGQYDQLECTVNGTPVWSNPTNANLIDTEWNQVLVDISFAAADPAATIEFTLTSDSGVNFGGWNVDDVQIFHLGQSGPQCYSQTYCIGKTTTIGSLPQISSTGTPGTATDDLTIHAVDLLPFKPGVYITADSPAFTPFLGGTLCVAPPLSRGPLLFADASGSLSWPFTVTPGVVGDAVFFQVWARDPTDPFGAALTDGMRIDFCND